MRNAAFIVSKPLQILVALSIIKQLGIQTTSYLVIVDEFFNAGPIYERMKSVNWEFSDLAVEFCRHHNDAYKFASTNKIENIFIDSDIGTKKYLQLLNIKFKHRATNISVYEEGLGTYRPDLYSGVKKSIFDILGVGTQFGGSSFTDSLYLYHPNEYQNTFPGYRKRLEKINLSPLDILRLYFNEFSFIFDYVGVSRQSSNECHLYLSSWDLDYNFIERFLAFPGDKYFKPHPHIKTTDLSEYGTLINRTAPVEMILADLKEKYEIVNVYHHGSSAEKYFNEKNVIFVRI